MLDSNLLLQDYEATARRLRRKGVNQTEIDAAREALVRRNELQTRVNQLRADRNQLSKEIGQLLADKKVEEAERLKAQVATSGKAEFEAVEASLRDAEAVARDLLLRLPNPPDDDAPEGLTENANVVLKTVGYDPKDYTGRSWRPHWEIGNQLAIFGSGAGRQVDGINVRHAAWPRQQAAARPDRYGV